MGSNDHPIMNKNKTENSVPRIIIVSLAFSVLRKIWESPKLLGRVALIIVRYTGNPFMIRRSPPKEGVNKKLVRKIGKRKFGITRKKIFPQAENF